MGRNESRGKLMNSLKVFQEVQLAIAKMFKQLQEYCKPQTWLTRTKGKCNLKSRVSILRLQDKDLEWKAMIWGWVRLVPQCQTFTSASEIANITTYQHFIFMNLVCIFPFLFQSAGTEWRHSYAHILLSWVEGCNQDWKRYVEMNWMNIERSDTEMRWAEHSECALCIIIKLTDSITWFHEYY